MHLRMIQSLYDNIFVHGLSIWPIILLFLTNEYTTYIYAFQMHIYSFFQCILALHLGTGQRLIDLDLYFKVTWF